MKLKDCLKTYTQDQDKAVSPAETISRAKAELLAQGKNILAESKRVDTGRLGIPVFMCVCGEGAREVMPGRKQMGKGATVEQAEASALMELVERYSFFSFWNNETNFIRASWSEAESLVPGKIMPVAEMIRSVGEEISEKDAVRVLDLVRWRFAPAWNLSTGAEVYAPLDWFKKLNEFNGSSAGNTPEESILQGACELVERHVCALIAGEQPILPSIDPKSITDPVLADLLGCYAKNNIQVRLKDFTLGMPVPTVGALAVDPATFPEKSEIVFTAGTATSPAKAAIRALTEVAQLAGDFETGANFEASGLPKYASLNDFEWIKKGAPASLDSLPDIRRQNFLKEINLLCKGLSEKGFSLYSVDITHPELGLAAHYNFVPGFQFRERAKHKSLGLFVGRILAEESPAPRAEEGLKALSEIYKNAPFVPFFKGLLALRKQELSKAAQLFKESEALQPDDEDRALAAFYQAYALTQKQDWAKAVAPLNRAVHLGPRVKEYFNLRGVALFKAKKYEQAAQDFKAAVDLDSGSAMDLANLGLCYKFMGQEAKAVHCLGTALTLDPTLEFARKHLDNILTP